VCKRVTHHRRFCNDLDCRVSTQLSWLPASLLLRDCENNAHERPDGGPAPTRGPLRPPATTAPSNRLKDLIVQHKGAAHKSVL